MGLQKKKWQVFEPDLPLVEQLQSTLNISEVLAKLLVNRGIKNAEAGRRFLFQEISELESPLNLKDMGKAVKKIAQDIASETSITIYGDYDVDGITATALLYKILSRLKARVDYYIPERQAEGYGLNRAALENIVSQGTQTIITVDCGISAVAEVLAFKDKIDIIITDHHEPPNVLPEAFAMINPKQTDCSYPDKFLAGVGVAFKLGQALWNYYGLPPEELYGYLDLVALGTIADIVPLQGENRILVQHGLRTFSSTGNVGLKALMHRCGTLPGQEIDSYKVGFAFAPRLNAAGRVSHANYSVRLLTTENAEEAMDLAEQLDLENSSRQKVEKEILEAAEKQLEEMDPWQEPLLVLAGEGWHSGVIGIVASRLVEKYYRPVVMISLKDGSGKGSCRSIPGFDMYQALLRCSECLEKYGGHPMAAGLQLKEEKLSEFRKQMALIARETLKENDYIPIIKIDMLVNLPIMDIKTIRELAYLAPYGMGNPVPVFASRKVALRQLRCIGKEKKHLKMRVTQSGTDMDAVAWNMGGREKDWIVGTDVDIAYVPEINVWQGNQNIQLRTLDLRDYQQEAVVLQITSGEVLLYDYRGREKAAFIASKIKETSLLAYVGNRKREDTVDIIFPQGVSSETENLTSDKGWIASQCLKYPKPINISAVLCHPPETMENLMEDIFRFSNEGYKIQEIYMLFNASEVQTDMAEAKQQRLEWKELAQLFLFLKQETPVNQVKAYNVGELLQQWNHTTEFWTTDKVITGLQIFQELGLVHFTLSSDEKAVEVVRKESPKEKLDLMESDTYRKSSLQFRQRMEWLHHLQQASVDRIGRCLEKAMKERGA